MGGVAAYQLCLVVRLGPRIQQCTHGVALTVLACYVQGGRPGLARPHGTRPCRKRRDTTHECLAHEV
jgi:hypothetical protein